MTCEGDGDVVGVVTPLRGGAQVVLHGVKVVQLCFPLFLFQCFWIGFPELLATRGAPSAMMSSPWIAAIESTSRQ